MTKTTVYLPEDLKRALEQLAATSGRSEADLIREAVASLTLPARRPRPRGALFTSGDGFLAAHDAEALAGFGDR